jgi:hypothetical protein
MKELKITVRKREDGEKVIRVVDTNSIWAIENPITFMLAVIIIIGGAAICIKKLAPWLF